MAAEIFNDQPRALDANGNPLSGAQWFFYATGTSTPQAVYANASLATSLGPVVTADSAGQFVPIYFDATKTYRAVLRTAAGALVKPEIDPANASGSVEGANNLGTLPSGSTNAIDISRTATSGAADGSSQFYSLVSRVYAQGSNSYSNVRGQYLGSHVNTTGGSVGLADALHAYVWQAGAGNIANVQVIAAHVRLDGPGDVTNEAICFRCVSTTLGAGVTVPTLKGLSIGDIGDATKVTNVYGIDIEDLVAASVAIGVRSVMNAATNKYFIFGAGTAQSAHNGHFGIGITNAPLWKLTVRESASTFVADFGNTDPSAPFGIRIQYTAAAPNGTDNAFITCQDTGATRFEVASNGRVKIGGDFVLNGRQTGCPAAATDLASAITLLNFLRTAGITHGMIS